MKSIKELKLELKEKTDVNPDKYYPTKILKEKGFQRNKCSKCGFYFWSLNETDVCGEPECGNGYEFIANPIGKKLSFIETWKSFSDFFKKRGYTPIKRYPVAARWRADTDFVQASIYNFQPHVVSGNAQPPANPLTVPQYCLRFNEIENVGITGRHNTGFVMIGQHAFTSSENYLQDKYFKDLFEWFVDELKIPIEELKVHESQWGGGGNLGVSMEFFAKGLELGNQVYMLYKVTENAYEELDLKVLDMGMGQGRVSWLLNGTSTMYESEYPETCHQLYEVTGIYPNELYERFIPYGSVLDIDVNNLEQLEKMWGEISQKMNVDKNELKESVMKIAQVYAVADHAQALLFALADGVLPSNVGGGYNLRAILRRALSFIYENNWNFYLYEVCRWHAEEWKEQYPELIDSLPEVEKIIKHEEKKYQETLEKAGKKVKNLIQKTKEIDFETMVQLYESDGITPELIKDISKKEKIQVKVPDNFYSRVSEKHETTVKENKAELDFGLEFNPTERLYYEKIFEFKAYVKDDFETNGKHYIVLDKTAFYPTSGGQDHDTGFIDNLRVVNVFTDGDIILHEVEGRNLTKGALVLCKVNKERREQLMKHHTATHIINGAAKRVLGNHIWQAGAEKKVDKAHLDITHYKNISDEEREKIEELANQVIQENREVVKEILPRGEAERKYGFRIYQGGAVPANEIRIINIPEWDVEACGGTHVDSTGEIGVIKILKTKRVQDGVIRIEFIAGEEIIQLTAEKVKREQEELIKNLVKKIIEMDSSFSYNNESIEKLQDIYRLKFKEKKKAVKEKVKDVELTEKVTFIEGVDMKVLQEIGRKNIKPDSCFVLISDGVVFAIKGEKCDCDVEAVATKVAEFMGGKIGSKGNEFKGGGPLRDKSKEAYELVKGML